MLRHARVYRGVLVLPVAVRHPHAQPFAAGHASGTGHLGGGAGLPRVKLDEDQPLRIKVELAFEPILARLPAVRTVLLGGVRDLFYA